jgi:hypothetical protein
MTEYPFSRQEARHRLLAVSLLRVKRVHRILLQRLGHWQKHKADIGRLADNPEGHVTQLVQAAIRK